VTVDVAEFQRRMEALYGERDRRRGADRTFGWFVEEVGEVSRALRRGTKADLEHEIGDAFAWLVSLANLEGVDVEAALSRYAAGCPRCSATPCSCPFVP
jgi:NTP pyrophosphatase (non-canonical NTP hydrolase)